MRTPTRAFVALAVAGSLTLAACGDDDIRPAASGEVTTSTTEPTTTTGPATEGPVEVTGIDYAFQGISPEVAVGTEFTFRNGGEEPHELILVKINDEETRSVEELLALGDEAEQHVTFKGVSVAAMPGSEGQVVQGELVADEPGRYVALCFIPVGSDPAVYQAAAEAGEPPAEDPDAGPPHFTRGMVQEFTVR